MASSTTGRSSTTRSPCQIPRSFPASPVLTDDDRVLLDRFVAVCRQLAGYSAINNDSGITISGKDGQSNIELQFPSAEAFGGTSLAFRQLHSGQEDASFDKVQGRLFQAIRILPEKEQQPAKDFLQQWVSARGKLMNQLLQTIVRRKGSPAPSARPKHRVQLLQYQPAGADTHSSTATPFTSRKSARSSRTCWMTKPTRPTTSTQSCWRSADSATSTLALPCFSKPPQQLNQLRFAAQPQRTMAAVGIPIREIAERHRGFETAAARQEIRQHQLTGTRQGWAPPQAVSVL